MPLFCSFLPIESTMNGACGPTWTEKLGDVEWMVLMCIFTFGGVQVALPGTLPLEHCTDDVFRAAGAPLVQLFFFFCLRFWIFAEAVP